MISIDPEGQEDIPSQAEAEVGGHVGVPEPGAGTEGHGQLGADGVMLR